MNWSNRWFWNTFSTKHIKFLWPGTKKLATSGRHKSAMITNAEKSRPTKGCLVSIFTVRITSNSYRMGCMLHTRKGLTQIFGNVRCPISSNCTLQCWCGLMSDILKKSRLDWKMIVSNKADNAGITQSQSCDTWCRRMHELNSLCVSK